MLKPTIAALGNFDGVHQGHRQVIAPVLPSAPLLQCQRAKVGQTHLYSTVITFSPHPQEFFSGQPKALLTPLAEKVRQLAALGIEQLILLPFNRELANLSPQAFVEELLVKTLQVKGVSVGQDFCFGQGRSGTALDLKTLAEPFSVPVEVVPLHYDQDDRISSSAIREALMQGNLPRANRFLGHPYGLEGLVVTGQRLGRTLGFPTANLQVSPQKFLPRQGVYGVMVEFTNDDGMAQYQPGVMNLGQRPTVDGIGLTVEVHLLDWQGDLYDKTLRVTLHHFLRSEQKFASLDGLKHQILQDCHRAQQLLAPYIARGVAGVL